MGTTKDVGGFGGFEVRRARDELSGERERETIPGTSTYADAPGTGEVVVVEIRAPSSLMATTSAFDGISRYIKAPIERVGVPYRIGLGSGDC